MNNYLKDIHDTEDLFAPKTLIPDLKADTEEDKALFSLLVMHYKQGDPQNMIEDVDEISHNGLIDRLR